MDEIILIVNTEYNVSRDLGQKKKIPLSESLNFCPFRILPIILDLFVVSNINFKKSKTFYLP